MSIIAGLVKTIQGISREKVLKQIVHKKNLPKKRVSLLKKFSRKHPVSGSSKNWTFLNFFRLNIKWFYFAWNHSKNISFAKIHYLFFYCCKMHLSSSESFENKWTFFVSYLTQKWQNSFIFQRKVNGLFVGRKRRIDATILIWIFCDSFAYTLEVRKCASVNGSRRNLMMSGTDN